MLMADAVRSLFAPHFGNGGLFGAGGVAELRWSRKPWSTISSQRRSAGPVERRQNGNDAERSALADMSNATQNTDGGNDDDYDTSSYDDGGFDDSNYA